MSCSEKHLIPMCRDLDLIVTHKSLFREERGKKFSCFSGTPIAGSPTGVPEKQENLKPQPSMKTGLVGNDQGLSLAKASDG